MLQLRTEKTQRLEHSGNSMTQKKEYGYAIAPFFGSVDGYVVCKWQNYDSYYVLQMQS